jgi:16S rRNA (cytidine1402-2'-O)-methyltransferase
VEILKNVDLILAEDTRTSSVLLNHYQIHKPITPFHQHNEHKVTAHLIEQLEQGKEMALLTDAGTPGISDPAFFLVRACVQQGIALECLPGATAFVLRGLFRLRKAATLYSHSFLQNPGQWYFMNLP